MKFGKCIFERMNILKTNSWASVLAGVFLAGAAEVGSAADFGQAFATPENAVSALIKAAAAHSTADLQTIFGPEAKELENPDRVQATNEMEAFAKRLEETNHIVRESDTRCELDVGADGWPFPVPLIKNGGAWFFDTAAGKEELLNRRIGRNELEVLKSMRAYVDAQREYASKDRNGDGVLQYAQRLASSPGKKDGLYWPTDLDGEISPLGPLVADAQTEGYHVQTRGQEQTRAPFHGYYFKILTRQGSNAPGGKYSYIINGRMIAGFALIAWPAEYGSSGVMTFMVNQQGRVYQRDMGADTTALAPLINTYDPGPGWSVSRE